MTELELAHHFAHTYLCWKYHGEDLWVDDKGELRDANFHHESRMAELMRILHRQGILDVWVDQNVYHSHLFYAHYREYITSHPNPCVALMCAALRIDAAQIRSTDG